MKIRELPPHLRLKAYHETLKQNPDIDDDLEHFKTMDLSESFNWIHSSDGFDYWWRVNNGYDVGDPNRKILKLTFKYGGKKTNASTRNE